ncbi:hypothetical protein ABT337_15560 [Saccharopolyspora hirsuta]|uniref:hypothetical protein n=1 Tax=Saccharopolyspora hirsuta TaxID=1837 RepID=UPI0033257328
MEYRIREARPAIEHSFGRVEFAEGTLVIWTTVFSFRIPVVGKLVDPAFGTALDIAFRLILRDVEKRALDRVRR